MCYPRTHVALVKASFWCTLDSRRRASFCKYSAWTRRQSTLLAFSRCSERERIRKRQYIVKPLAASNSVLAIIAVKQQRGDEWIASA